MLMKNLRRSFIITLAFLQVGFFPHMGFAEGTSDDPSSTPDTSTSTPVDPASTQGPTSPTGADGQTFVYNPDTGLWENDFYTWNPVTKQTAPKPGTVDYSYNPATGKWDTTEWRYDAPSGKYVPNVIEKAVLPAGAPVSPDSPVQPSTGSSLTTGGPDSSINSTDTTNTNGQYDLFYNASISNKISGTATTGDATVNQNTLGGNAGTGDASDMATILNILQSVWDPSNGDIATFHADIDGDVTGDITINPSQIPGQLSSSDNKSNSNLVVNDSESTAINNDVDLSAKSGTARVTDNTTGGNATSGTANVVANVVNLLNSYIGSGRSFVGTININGDLDGDILLPPEMLDELLASNVPKATIDLSKIHNSNVAANLSDTTNIHNNVDASASSGNANVSNNSSAGSATTGNSSTMVTFLNLTGRQIIGSNALLVFVNVRGKWIGMIMDAPGATSAMLGGGIVSDETNENVDINSDSKTDINNNIKLNAQSGDADVSSNTTAGNAKTGNASASANIANVSNSKFSLTGWFGILFINVFGNWLGSFGINTSAGNKPVAPATAQTDVQVFGFTPKADGSFSLTSVPTNGNLGTAGDAGNTSSVVANAQVLGASTIKPAIASSPAGLNPVAKAYIILAFAGLFIMLGGKLVAFLKAKKSTI